ncbi:harmonin-binding protein USHBP1 isoform X2 [Rhineura floridana]|uniref:harmonin-binding protein USHBP1 isoform X2 n=1 Tax=Rhineura floridana TaxID=261503 RepID=UPI002AC87668|nr:harmonin-binding protein USHBP1 isoform X2 [Rhineura floridana]
MKKGTEDPMDERLEEDERAILRYEEHITGLLVTVAHLHGKIERLQEKKAREDDECSDLCSEYTASLPRCPLQFPNLAMVLPPPKVHPDKGNGDLFLDVHKAVTSLENTVFSHRSRIPSTDAELEGYAQVAEGLEESLRKFQGGDKDPLPKLDLELKASEEGFLVDGMSIHEREIALFEERNMALRAELEGRNEELARSKATLCAYQEERDKLQRKVKQLHSALSKMETPLHGSTSPVSEKALWGFQDPLLAAQSFVCCFQGAPGAHPGCCLYPQHSPPSAETPTKGMEDHRQQLRGSIEKLRGLNQLLSATLQESKSDTERVSLLLGRRESDNTALRLAVQYSERCLEAYERLFSLARVKLHPRAEAAEAGDLSHAGSPLEMKLVVMNEAYQFLQSRSVDVEGPGLTLSEQRAPELWGSADERKVLREYIRSLRAEQASLKLPAASWPPPGPDSPAARINARIDTKVAEVQRATRDALPSKAAQPKMDKARLLHELEAAREALGDLNTRMHLAEKEKQGLELQMYTYRAQEAACLLMAQILQAERDELRGQQIASSGGSNSSSGESSSEESMPRRTLSSSSEDIAEEQPSAEPRMEASQLLETLTSVNCKNKELEDRIHSLLLELEEGSQESRAQEVQQVALTRDFFKAHSALVFAYRNARKKQEAQLHQLETQIGLMGQRQTRQLQSLMQALRRLEALPPYST